MYSTSIQPCYVVCLPQACAACRSQKGTEDTQDNFSNVLQMSPDLRTLRDVAGPEFAVGNIWCVVNVWVSPTGGKVENITETDNYDCLLLQLAPAHSSVLGLGTGVLHWRPIQAHFDRPNTSISAEKVFLMLKFCWQNKHRLKEWIS